MDLDTVIALLGNRKRTGIGEFNRLRKMGDPVPPLNGVNLNACYMERVDFSGLSLRKAKLNKTLLNFAKFTGADLTGAAFKGAVLNDADFRGANLSNANLREASLVRTDFRSTNLTGAEVYGVSAWGVQLEGAIQQDLVVSPRGEIDVTVDNLEMAQFLYLLLSNEKLRTFIDTITSKAVLILGRFTPERKAVLDAIRGELRRRNYLPMMFDFQKPRGRDFTETVVTLAHMARFIVADITEPRSLPQELQAIVPTLAVPVQPLLLSSENEYGMFSDFKKYPWVLEVLRYRDVEHLLMSFEQEVVLPAEAKVVELRSR